MRLRRKRVVTPNIGVKIVIVWLFWLSLSGLVYIYLGYPLMMRILAKVRPLQRQKTRPTDPSNPEHKVSVVIASFNDAPRLDVKLRDLLASPQAQWIGEILIGCDGSTDNTAEVLAALNDSRIRLFAFADRRGKPAVLNDLVPQCECPIVVFCDARQLLAFDAIPELLANFADPQVGVVSGELMFREQDDESTATRGISAYWRYEKMIRKAEARFRSVPGATGALYAIRKSLFRPMPESTLLDDVVVPMNAIVQGFRCVFERRAIAWDVPSSTLEQEAVRKRRTIAGAAQLMLHHPRWLLPWVNPIWFEYVSHKLLRLASPLCLLTCLICHCLLLSEQPYLLLSIPHSFFYYSAIAGWWCQRMGRPSQVFGVQLMFFTLNVTTVAALWDAANNRFRVTWQRT